MPGDALLCIAVIGGAAAAAVLAGGSLLVNGAALAAVLLAMIVSRGRPDRGFYILAAGILCVAAVAETGAVAAAAAMAASAAMALRSSGLLAGRSGAGAFGAYAVIASAVLFMALSFRHAWIPLGIAAALAAIAVLVSAASAHRLTRTFGRKP